MSETLEDDEMLVIVIEDEDNLDYKQKNSDDEQQNNVLSRIKIETVDNSANDESGGAIFNLPTFSEKRESREHNTESQEENDEEDYEIEYLEDTLEFEMDDDDDGGDLKDTSHNSNEGYSHDDTDDEDFSVQTDTNPGKMKLRNRKTFHKTWQTKKEYKKTTQKKQAQKNTRKRAVQEKVPQSKPPAICVSYVAQLRKENPEMAKDKELLIEHLISIMRELKPPDPPEDFCKEVIEGENVKFECSFCGWEFEKMPVAARHYQTSHGEAYLTCYACGNTYTNNPNLYRHEKRCRAPDAGVVLRARARFLLAQCHGRSYFGKRSESKPQKRFFCSQCPASFQQPASLESHENRHTGKRPFRCNMCTMAYPSYHALQRHSKLHGECRYTCDHCGRGFHHKPSLKSHLDSHRAVRKHPCMYCERRFAQKTSLTHHMNKVHLDLPPAHGCPVCPKRYARLFHVREHMAKAHGLAMITRKMFFKALPGMTDAEVAHAKKFFDVEVSEKIKTENTFEKTKHIAPDSTEDAFDEVIDEKDDVRLGTKQIHGTNKTITKIMDRNSVPKSRVPYIEFPIKTKKAGTKQDEAKTENIETDTETKVESKNFRTKLDTKTETAAKSKTNVKTQRNVQIKSNSNIDRNLKTKKIEKTKTNLKSKMNLKLKIKPEEKELISSPKEKQIKEPRPVRNKRPPQRCIQDF